MLHTRNENDYFGLFRGSQLIGRFDYDFIFGQEQHNEGRESSCEEFEEEDFDNNVYTCDGVKTLEELWWLPQMLHYNLESYQITGDMSVVIWHMILLVRAYTCCFCDFRRVKCHDGGGDRWGMKDWIWEGELGTNLESNSIDCEGMGVGNGNVFEFLNFHGVGCRMTV